MHLASRIMHLAVAARLLPELPLTMDVDRFLTGSLLPDASARRDASHFLVRDGNLRTYDLPRFRVQFGHLMLTDGLTLGYYMHLLQDLAFRKFMYSIMRFDPTEPGYLPSLYVDYGLLNRILPARENLPAAWDFPSTADPLSAIVAFDLPALQRDLAADLASRVEGKSTYLTAERADVYIEMAAELCRRELSALIHGQPLLDPYDGYIWQRDPHPKEEIP